MRDHYNRHKKDPSKGAPESSSLDPKVIELQQYVKANFPKGRQKAAFLRIGLANGLITPQMMREAGLA